MQILKAIMVTLTKQSLLYSEELTLPSFQVIVMTANIGCDSCQERVSQVVSKMTGIREYTVDVPKKQVIVKGDFGSCKEVKDDYSKIKIIKSTGCYPLKLFLKSFRVTCFSNIES